eukprot:284815797_4
MTFSCSTATSRLDGSCTGCWMETLSSNISTPMHIIIVLKGWPRPARGRCYCYRCCVVVCVDFTCIDKVNPVALCIRSIADPTIADAQRSTSSVVRCSNRCKRQIFFFRFINFYPRVPPETYSQYSTRHKQHVPWKYGLQVHKPDCTGHEKYLVPWNWPRPEFKYFYITRPFKEITFLQGRQFLHWSAVRKKNKLGPKDQLSVGNFCSSRRAIYLETTDVASVYGILCEPRLQSAFCRRAEASGALSTGEARAIKTAEFRTFERWIRRRYCTIFEAPRIWH